MAWPVGRVPRQVLGVTMRVVVVAHHSRAEQAHTLAARVAADAVLMDPTDHGARWAHGQALLWTAKRHERTWVLEDDALPSRTFRDEAESWGERFPDDLISGYLGRSRPTWLQGRMRRLIDDAETGHLDRVRLPYLAHGVCYSLPAGTAGDVYRNLAPGPADYAIGDTWGKPVLYPLPSLVDHADGASVERHPDGQARVKGRVAWRPPLEVLSA